MRFNLSPKMRTIVWWLGIAYLIVPFALLRLRITEPYPALIMPGGAAKVRIEDNLLLHNEWIVEAIMPDGTEHRLDPHTFFDPIPKHYWTRLARRDFGFSPPRTKTVHMLVTRLTFSLSRENSPEDLEQVRVWIKERMTAAGHGDAKALRVILSKSTFNIKENQPEDREVASEFTIDLD